ncbi:MAG: hypothetical protein AAFX55_18190, partial [Bacteroidota bacterium]
KPKLEITASSPKTEEFWDDISMAKIARLIKRRYADNHFTMEMLYNFLEKKRNIRTEYYSSEELKKNPSLNTKQDLKQFVFSAIEPQDPENPNPFLSLNQHFYNSIEENFLLKIKNTDYKFYKEKDEKQRASIYFSVNK